jgi:hypothetical protein
MKENKSPMSRRLTLLAGMLTCSGLAIVVQAIAPDQARAEDASQPVRDSQRTSALELRELREASAQRSDLALQLAQQNLPLVDVLPASGYTELVEALEDVAVAAGCEPGSVLWRDGDDSYCVTGCASSADCAGDEVCKVTFPFETGAMPDVTTESVPEELLDDDGTLPNTAVAFCWTALN